MSKMTGLSEFYKILGILGILGRERRERERESGSHGAQGVRVDASNGKKTNDVEW